MNNTVLQKKMRIIAPITDSEEHTRAMVYEDPGGGVYLFLYSTEFDSGASADYWFETIADAVEVASEDYGIDRNDWSEIDDPLPHCQHDWITPARIPGREDGAPQWGRLQLLLDGAWQELDMSAPSTIKIPMENKPRHSTPDRSESK